MTRTRRGGQASLQNEGDDSAPFAIETEDDKVKSRSGAKRGAAKASATKKNESKGAKVTKVAKMMTTGQNNPAIVSPKSKVEKKEAAVAKSAMPRSIFEQGKFTAGASYGGRKDSRSKMYWEYLACGVVTVYIAKPNGDEAFLVPDYKLLEKDMDLKEQYKILTICARRGADGENIPQSSKVTYPFRQFVLTVFPNNRGQAKIQVSEFLKFLNDRQDSGEYKYPNKIRTAKDFTHSPPRPADSRLVDKEVVLLMLASFPHIKLNDLVEYNETMAKFWNCSEHGTEYINEFLENQAVDSCDDEGEEAGYIDDDKEVIDEEDD